MKKQLLIASLALTLGFSVQAEEAQTTKANWSDMTVPGSNEDPQGWVPFAAIGVNAVEFDQTLANRDGEGGNARIIGSYYNSLRNWVFDTGLGFESTELNGDTVNSGLAEHAARFRFGSTKKWSLGPVANMNFGNNVGLDHGSTADNVVTFAGGQLVRDFAYGESTMFRAGLKAMTDIGVHNSTANKFLFELQAGATSPTQVTETHKEVAQEEQTQEEIKQEVAEMDKEIVQEAAATTPVEESVETIKVPTSIYFAFDKSEMGPRNTRVAKKLAEILRNNKQEVKSVRMTGYADTRGTEPYNMDLSQARATTVLEELSSEGVNFAELNKNGQGEVETANFKSARRVDIEVSTTKGSELLRELQELKSIQ